MPQLDVASYPSQLFWLVVSFLILYGILQFFIVPRFSKIFEKRAEFIDILAQKASRDREEAELLLNEYERILAEARIEAHGRFQSVFDEVSAHISKKQTEILEHIAEKIRLHEQDIYRERIHARKDMDTAIADVTAWILTKMTGKAFAPKTILEKMEVK